jgi:hypothetical protein
LPCDAGFIGHVLRSGFAHLLKLIYPRALSLCARRTSGLKSYFVDEIGVADAPRIRHFLNTEAIRSGIDTLFWVKVAPTLLTPLQNEHISCQPHVFAVETGDRFLKAELYLRTLRDMRCPCQGHCTPQQASFIIEWVDEMLKDLSIRT